MAKKKDSAKRLGADRTFTVKTDAQGPLSWMQLCKEVAARLQSTGGRPSDPKWSFRRQVPFQKQTWRTLALLAKALKHQGTSIGPGQIAAILVEHQLEILYPMLETNSPQALQQLVKGKVKPEIHRTGKS